jgi:hypothetical protein
MSNVVVFPRRPGIPEHRHGPDRREQRRGGRRANDKPGYAPLVLLVDDDAGSSSRCEAILARLHFAVAPTRTVEEATRVMEALRPNIIVARVADAAAVRQATATEVPVVLLNDDLMNPEVLVNEIRRTLRSRRR